MTWSERSCATFCFNAFPNGMPDTTALTQTNDRDVALTLSRRVIDRDTSLVSVSARDVATFLALLSKWYREESCRKAAAVLAMRLKFDGALRESLGGIELAGCVASLAKWNEDEESFREAALSLIRDFVRRSASPGYLNGQAVANFFSALGIWHHDPVCKEAGRLLAKRISADDGILRQLNGVRVAICIHALSRWKEDDACHVAGIRLAGRISEDGNLRHNLNARYLAVCLDALAQWPSDDVCRRAAAHLARRLTRDSSVCDRLSAKHFINCLKALGALSEQAACKTAGARLVKRLTSDRTLLQQLAGARYAHDCLSALTSWPSDEAGFHAAAEAMQRYSNAIPNEALMERL
jgi:hypothetical protein